MSELSPRSWLRDSRTLAYVGVLAFIVGIALGLNVTRGALNKPGSFNPLPGGIISLGLAIIGFKIAMRGGATIDHDDRSIIRWWGPTVAIREKRFPFSTIQAVLLSAGIVPRGIQAAREESYSYNVAIETDSGCTVVRWTKSLDDAKSIAATIAEAVGCPLKDCLKTSDA